MQFWLEKDDKNYLLFSLEKGGGIWINKTPVGFFTQNQRNVVDKISMGN